MFLFFLSNFKWLSWTKLKELTMGNLSKWILYLASSTVVWNIVARLMFLSKILLYESIVVIYLDQMFVLQWKCFFFFAFFFFCHRNSELKTKEWISKRVLQETKARQIYRKTNIPYNLIRTCTCVYQGLRNVCFLGKFDSAICLITDDRLET